MPPATDQRSVYFPPPTRPRPVSPTDESAPPLFQTVPDPETRSDSSNLEKFIGENLIAMVGAVITVIGVAIGAKYAIDKGWITPVMRIVFGYLIGIGLLIPAFRLREKMSRFSAVTLSGSMAIFYFVTYAAYSFYDLIPQPFAFALMVLFTAFTVFAAIRYERVVIAHIGMVWSLRGSVSIESERRPHRVSVHIYFRHQRRDPRGIDQALLAFDLFTLLL
ncbi:MAG: DUF2339 domain-containing protein [Acidobacteria bacterium]|nr:DUF2339 domain-containing protein [Acidobacteriota bacterium]